MQSTKKVLLDNSMPYAYWNTILALVHLLAAPFNVSLLTCGLGWQSKTAQNLVTLHFCVRHRRDFWLLALHQLSLAIAASLG